MPSSHSRKALLYVLNSGNMYGTERMALATLAGMSNYDVRVVFAPPPSGIDSVATAALKAGYQSITFETRSDFVRCLLPWLLRYREIDMIGTQVGQAYLAHYLAKVFFVRLRQLQVVHGGTEDAHAYGRKRRLNRLPVRIVAVSDFVRRRLEAHGIRPFAICVINNFLSKEAENLPAPRPPYDPARAAAMPLKSPIRVIVVSRVDPIKRIGLLVEAIEQHGLGRFHFDVYGAGEQLEAFRQRTTTRANIFFHGYVGDVRERFAQADFFLHLCPVEPFGMVILEAFLSRIVVIVPDAGGAGSLVDDGIDGLRFEADSIASLISALERAASLTGGNAQRLADAALAKLNKCYRPDQGQRRYLEALESVEQL